MSIVRRDFGAQNNGESFPLQYPATMGMRAGQSVDALLLNEIRYGGDGGGEPGPGALTLGENEYWNYFKVAAGGGDAAHGWIFGLALHTSEGVNNIAGGSYLSRPAPAGVDVFEAAGIRILRVGGRAINERILTALSVEFVSDYVASTFIQDASAVLDFKAGEVEVDTYADSKIQYTQSYDYLTSDVQERNVNASAKGEYYATFAFSTGLKETATSTEDIKQTSSTTIENIESVKDTIPADKIGVLVCNIKVMRDSNGNYFAYPTGGANWVKLYQTDRLNLLGYYDFTAGIELQFGLTHVNQNGFKVLSAH